MDQWIGDVISCGGPIPPRHQSFAQTSRTAVRVIGWMGRVFEYSSLDNLSVLLVDMHLTLSFILELQFSFQVVSVQLPFSVDTD